MTSKTSACGECGMVVRADEYHPYAACLMFLGCHDGETVRANLLSVQASGAQAECDLRAEQRSSKPKLFYDLVDDYHRSITRGHRQEAVDEARMALMGEYERVAGRDASWSTEAYTKTLRAPSEPAAAPAHVEHALEELETLRDYAYDNGFHELGYDPVSVVRAALSQPPTASFIAELQRLRHLTNDGTTQDTLAALVARHRLLEPSSTKAEAPPSDALQRLRATFDEFVATNKGGVLTDLISIVDEVCGPSPTKEACLTCGAELPPLAQWSGPHCPKCVAAAEKSEPSAAEMANAGARKDLEGFRNAFAERDRLKAMEAEAARRRADQTAERYEPGWKDPRKDPVYGAPDGVAHEKPAVPMGGQNFVKPTQECEDCPPVGYPTNKTRCAPCPRRTESEEGSR